MQCLSNNAKGRETQALAPDMQAHERGHNMRSTEPTMIEVSSRTEVPVNLHA